MAGINDLGKIEYEENLKSVWADEPAAFTPWLERNIDLLGEALGLELEIEQREAPVGPFRVDLLGRELGTDRVVIVENQLGESDHDHLGKLVTYWAGREAGVAIWIASKITDAHREAIYRLNAETPEGIDAFAVEIELVRIGCSPLAPHFSVVVRPRPKLTQPPSAYYEFHTDLLRRLHGVTNGFQTRASGNGRYLTFLKELKQEFRLATAFEMSLFYVELYIDNPSPDVNDAALAHLFEHREGIEAQIGTTLVWDRIENRKGNRVYAGLEGNIESPPERLEEFKQWAVDLLPKFREVFAPHIAALNLDALAATEEARD